MKDNFFYIVVVYSDVLRFAAFVVAPMPNPDVKTDSIVLQLIVDSHVLILICEGVLCLELVFAELGQAHYK